MHLDAFPSTLYSKKNLFISIVVSFLCVLSSLLLCQILIEGALRLKPQSSKTFAVDFIPLEKRARRPHRPLKPIKQMQQSPIATMKIEPNLFLTDNLNPAFDPFTNNLGLPNIEIKGLVYGDGNYFPRIKLPPIYPLEARTRGIEGACLVEYTITDTGTVTDVVAVPGECRSIFKNNSTDATRNFVYRPRIVNGVPQTVRKVRNRFIFELQEND